MPKTRGESIFFTAITAWMMVYVMTLYITVLAMGSFTNTTFLTALMYLFSFVAGFLFGEMMDIHELWITKLP